MDMDLQSIADKLAAVLTVLVPLLAAFSGWAAAGLGKIPECPESLLCQLHRGVSREAGWKKFWK